MNVLEKILEEIEERVNFRECLVKYEKRRGTITDVCRNKGALEELDIIAEIIRSHMDEAKDINVPSNDGWIPVEERLPDGLNKELYDINLVTLEDGEVCIGVYRDDKKEWWTRKKEGETLYTTKHNVIAWQPLPEPYKPKKDIEDSGARS